MVMAVFLCFAVMCFSIDSDECGGHSVFLEDYPDVVLCGFQASDILVVRRS